MAIEHYRYKVDESKNAIWYADSRGFIFKYYKKSNMMKLVKGYSKRGFRVVKINYKEQSLSHVIAKTFIKEYDPNNLIGYKDGNKQNCNVNNLFIYSRNKHGKETGYLSKSKPVIIREDGKYPLEFRSVRKAAKYLFVSYQTLLDFLSGEINHSVLDKKGRDIYFKEVQI